MDIIDILLGAKLGGGGGSGGGSSSFVPTFGTVASVSLGTTWSGSDPYTSTVTVTGYTVTDKTMVSVLPSTAVLAQMLSDGTTNIFITNDNGTLIATAIGAAPTQAMTLTVLCSESDQAAAIGNLAGIVGDGVLEVLGATDLTDAVNLLNTDVSDVKNAIDQKAPLIINTASGNVASFADGADGMQIREIVGTIVTSEGGSGWTGANIVQRGKNLCPTRNCSEIITTWTQNGSNFVKEIKGLDPSKYYTFSLTVLTALGTSGERRLYVNGNSYGFINTGSEIGRLSRTIKPAENGIITLTQNVTAARDTAYQNALIDFQLEADSVVTAFEAYKSQTLPINWQAEAGTILNGTVTLNEDRSADVVNSGTGDSYHLTDVGNLSTYYGVNNVWIDTGAINECDYPADTKLYIDGLTEPDEDMIADGLIASGKYFTVNNQLYLSTAQIAAGAQIIPGSNCTATNLVEALNALNT